jgi:hypothetical protein
MVCESDGREEGTTNRAERDRAAFDQTKDYVNQLPGGHHLGDFWPAGSLQRNHLDGEAPHSNDCT